MTTFGNLVCPLIDGCPIKKGVCIGCIEKTLHKHNQQDSSSIERTYTKTKPSITIPKKTKIKSRCIWKCVIAPCDDDMLPKGCVWLSE